MEYERKALLRARDTFDAKADIGEVLQFVRELNIPGELIVTLPGNGGVRSVTFIEKERAFDVKDDPPKKYFDIPQQ